MSLSTQLHDFLEAPLTSAHHSDHIHPCAFLHPVILFCLLNIAEKF